MRSPDAPPVLVFDLDGTLLSHNSFPFWVLFLITGWLPGIGWRRRLALSLHVMGLVLWRKIGLMKHEELQRRLQVAWQAVNSGGSVVRTDQLEAMLLRRVRPNLRSCLGLVVDRQWDAVLATAAAEDYAEPLGRRLGIRHILATRSGRVAGERANSGTAKRQRVADFLRGAGWRDRALVLFTDHIDDLPLIRTSNVVCWFGSTQSLSSVRAMAEGTRFIQCREMSEELLLATFDALCNHSPDHESDIVRVHCQR